MERKEMDDSTGGCRLLPPLYPYSRTTTTSVPRPLGINSHHHQYSRPHPYQLEPVAAFAAHFSSQVSPATRAYQLPPSPLTYATHASAGGSGAGASVAYGSGYTASGSSSYQWPPSLLPQTHSWGSRSVVDGGSAACDASQVALLGSSCYQMPPPSTPALDPAGMLGGGLGGIGSSSTTMPGHGTFHSSLDTGMQASVAGLLPPLSSLNNNLMASLSPSPTPLLTEGAASVGLTQEKYNLPPLPPSLGGPPPPQTATLEGLLSDPAYIPLVDVDDEDDSGNNVVQYVDLDGLCGGLNNSGQDRCSHCPPLASPSLPLPVPVAAPANALVNWSSLAWSTSQLGNNTIPSSSSSSRWMPQPYSSAVTPSNSLPVPEANNGVKEEAVDWSSQPSRLGKNTITTGAGSSASMPQPTHSSVMVAGSKKKLSSSSGAPAGSGIHCKDHTGSPMFTQDDIDKIMADKGLKDLVLEDPKRVRGILNNRRNSNKSSKKKKAYLSNLEHKVKLLQQQKNSLSAQVISLQSTTISLIAEKNEMITKLHGFEQQAQLANAQREALNAEVHRLKLAAGETMGSQMTQ